LRLSLLTEEWKDSGSSATDENSTPEGKAALLDPLGITVKSLTMDQARKIGVEVGEGVIISKAAKTGVGYLAGLGEGDIITAIDGHKVNTLRTYHGSLLHADLGKGCIVQFISQGSRRFEILRSDTN
jgi:S1-C subfamily serine protease